jgi:hypothetical protein
VADVGADLTGRRQPDLRIHVGPIHVNLAAMLMHDRADLFDPRLEHAMRRWIRIIEAMKLMNEIDSEYDGEIVNIYVENGQAVQYGERLFAIRLRS